MYSNEMGHLVRHTGFNGDAGAFRLKGNGVVAVMLTVLLVAAGDIMGLEIVLEIINAKFWKREV